MYLTQEALGQTLAQVAALAPGTEFIADYMLPAGLRDAEGDGYVAQVAPLAAQRGEPWRTFLAPGDLTALLAGHGFARTTHLTQREALPPALWDRPDPLHPTGLSCLAHATLTPQGGVAACTAAEPGTPTVSTASTAELAIRICLIWRFIHSRHILATTKIPLVPRLPGIPSPQHSIAGSEGQAERLDSCQTKKNH
jgi:hypothetical protein